MSWWRQRGGRTVADGPRSIQRVPARARGAGEMRVTPAGRFPIVRAGQHPLRKALEEWRARSVTAPASALSDDAVLAAQAAVAQELIDEQERAGVDLPTDGYVPVYDEWFAWAPSVSGVRLEKHIRYLDTNTY